VSAPALSPRMQELGPAPVQVALPAEAASLAVVRQTLSGVAAAIGMSQDRLDDLMVAVTEACTNVVLHAYGDAIGPMQVHAWPLGNRLVLLVRDEGAGMVPRVERQSPGLGLGLGMIATLAADVSIASEPGRGTEVWMTFPLEAVTV
jgi:serine/threonine-protein kinase RsbW